MILAASAVDEELTEDLDAYHRARFMAARRAGLTRLESSRFAFGPVPLRTLRKLVAEGCPAVTIARIVT